jgi:hypothetical protein
MTLMVYGVVMVFCISVIGIIRFIEWINDMRNK